VETYILRGVPQRCWSIDGFRAIGNPPSVFHATAALSRVSKKAEFIVWFNKKSRKRRLKNNHFQDDEKHLLLLVDSTITN
jgi:hypothetical protein